ncbi:MAG: TetR/AcrR family transcriptional regulator [Nitriliruptorales bacterium]|nr:TetR/AcrR family transcriptional regulator [Nitriliruptorales bacterium]
MGTYDTPVRDRRAAATRAAILEALGELVAASGIAELSVQQVADRAGVSHRTVYRHFPDRTALLDALGVWVQQRLGDDVDETAVDRADDLVEMIAPVFAGLDLLTPASEAMARISVAEGARSAEHLARTARMRDALMPALEERVDDPDAVFAILRHLLSALTWWVARDEFGLDGDRAGQAVATIVDAVLHPPAADQPSAPGTGGQGFRRL